MRLFKLEMFLSWGVWGKLFFLLTSPAVCVELEYMFYVEELDCTSAHVTGKRYTKEPIVALKVSQWAKPNVRRPRSDAWMPLPF